MAKFSTELRAGNLHPRENLFASGNLAALNAVVTCYADGASNIMTVITGVYTGVIVYEGSNDNWATVDLIAIKPINAGGLFVLSLASGAIGRWSGSCGKFQQVRARMSTAPTGAATVLIMADNGLSDLIAIPKADQFHVDAIGTAGAALTLTLPAPGTGLFPYVSRIQIVRFAAAALTAAAAPIAVTTTNLVGARTFRLAADAAAQGAKDFELYEGSKPLRGSAANTALTIIMPLTTGVLWFASADYDNLPEA
jgi:hypothetical protein